MTKSDLPPKDRGELAEDLLARLPGVDRAQLLKDMVAHCFFEMKYGNKREERAACDFLNEVQRLAIRNTRLHSAHSSSPAVDIQMPSDAEHGRL